MKLYQNPMSPPCRRALATAYHLNSPVEIQHVDFQSDQLKSDQYLKMNPNGSVPLLEDGDFHLWESSAIMQYLAEKSGHTTFFPQDIKGRADLARWTSWSAYHFGPAIGTIVWESFLKPMFKMGDADAKAVEEATVDFHRYAKVLDQHLEGREYILGKNLTAVDFNIASNLMYADAAKLPWNGYKNIVKWYKHIETVDAWKKSAPPRL